MAEPIRILSVERQADYGLIISFTDGTTARYVVDDLLDLRPHRDPTLVDPFDTN